MVGVSIATTLIEAGAIAVVYGMQESLSFHKFIKENTSTTVYNALDMVRQYGVNWGILRNTTPAVTVQNTPTQVESTVDKTNNINVDIAVAQKNVSVYNEEPFEDRKPDITIKSDDVNNNNSDVVNDKSADSIDHDEMIAADEFMGISSDIHPHEKHPHEEQTHDTATKDIHEETIETSNTPIDDKIDQIVSMKEVVPTTVESIVTHEEVQSHSVIPTLPVEVIAKNLTTETTEAMIHELTIKSIALRKEYEETLLKDLHNMDEQTLRYRYMQLASDLFERNKWEGVRLQQALKHLESEVSRKYLELMNQQRQELESQTSSLLQKKESEFENAKISEIEAIRLKLTQELEEVSLKLKNSYEDNLKQEVDQVSSKIRSELEDKYTHDIALQRQDFMKNQLQLQDKMEGIRSQILMFNKIIDETSTVKAISKSLHKSAAAALIVEQAIQTAQPIGQVIEVLLDTSNDDDLVTAVANTIPQKVKKSWAYSIPELKLRFAVVRNETRKAALAPENMPPFLGQIVGNALATISWTPKGYRRNSSKSGVSSRTREIERSFI
jgi:Mitochondrial inner membrane protein